MGRRRNVHAVETAEVNRYIAQLREQTADLLRDLTPEQWEAQSLCEGWKVREVAAHLSVLGRMSPISMAQGMVKALGSFNRYVDNDAREHAAKHDTGELIAELRLAANNFNRPPGTSKLDPLADVIVHTLDITVPLGIEWSAPTDAAIAAAERLAFTGGLLMHAKHMRGLRLEATNANWGRGEGPVVRGPIELLLLLLAGRRIPLTGLEGDGVEVLRKRGV